MSLVLNMNEPAIVRGIKTVGVGKKGSKSLSLQLAREILEDLKLGKVKPAAKGAFFAGLLAKGIEPDELVLAEAFEVGVLNDPQRLVEVLAADAPALIRWVCVQLLTGQTLDKQTAYDLGRFLFSDEAGDGARGLVASFLRVRYETADEYEGIWQAMQETIAPFFRQQIPSGAPIIQLAEPFDGVDHSYMITPLVASFLQAEGYRAVHMVGRNSGPKFEMNLWDIAQALDIAAAEGSMALRETKPKFGWFFHQSRMSLALDRWVVLRHQTVKRPFLSTLERFINPVSADILIASAFHPPYGEKMMTIAERAGFKATIIVRNGIEGSVAFPLLRPVKMLLSAKQADGSFLRHEIILEPPAGVSVEEMIEHPRAMDNARLIKAYAAIGTSGNQHFDLRIKFTCAGLQQGLKWLNENMHSPLGEKGKG